MLSWDGNIKQPCQDSYIFSVKQEVLDQDEELCTCSQVSTVLASVSRTLHPKLFLDDLIDRVDTGCFGHIISALKSTRRQGALVKELMEVWGIGKKAA